MCQSACYALCSTSYTTRITNIGWELKHCVYYAFKNIRELFSDFVKEGKLCVLSFPYFPSLPCTGCPSDCVELKVHLFYVGNVRSKANGETRHGVNSLIWVSPDISKWEKGTGITLLYTASEFQMLVLGVVVAEYQQRVKRLVRREKIRILEKLLPVLWLKQSSCKFFLKSVYCHYLAVMEIKCSLRTNFGTALWEMWLIFQVNCQSCYFTVIKPI